MLASILSYSRLLILRSRNGRSLMMGMSSPSEASIGSLPGFTKYLAQSVSEFRTHLSQRQCFWCRWLPLAIILVMMRLKLQKGPQALLAPIPNAFYAIRSNGTNKPSQLVCPFN
jgi:hypothetical protein